MKLRIRGNSIRLRLSQGDVKVFGEKGKLKQSINFGGQDGGHFFYSIQLADVPKLKCRFSNNHIQVFVPQELGKIWANTPLVGMEHLDENLESEDLRILIEKDYHCLQNRINEDESDSFPHPKERH